jgi:nucleoside 2-deoxyribosyltransferase
MNYVYLCGAILGEPDGGKIWRLNAKQLLPVGWKSVDPTDYPSDKMSSADLVAHDYALIDRCKAVVARVNKPSWGTAMELTYAKRMAIPVIGWTLGIESHSPWLHHHCDVMFDSLEEACRHLKHYA